MTSFLEALLKGNFTGSCAESFPCLRVSFEFGSCLLTCKCQTGSLSFGPDSRLPSHVYGCVALRTIHRISWQSSEITWDFSGISLIRRKGSVRITLKKICTRLTALGLKVLLSGLPKPSLSSVPLLYVYGPVTSAGVLRYEQVGRQMLTVQETNLASPNPAGKLPAFHVQAYKKLASTSWALWITRYIPGQARLGSLGRLLKVLKIGRFLIFYFI